MFFKTGFLIWHLLYSGMFCCNTEMQKSIMCVKSFTKAGEMFEDI